MSLIKINTVKSSAMDIQLSYTVYFENGMKVGKEGYWGSPEELKQKIGRYLEAAYGSKIKKIEATDGDSEAKAEDSAYLSAFPSYHPIHAFPEVIQKMERCINREWPSSVNSKVSSAQRMMKDALRDLETYMKKVDAEDAQDSAATDAKTDWNMEVYKLIGTVEKLLKKAQAEGATGSNSYGELFRNCLKVLRGY